MRGWEGSVKWKKRGSSVFTIGQCMPLAISLEACLKSLQGKLNPEESDRVPDLRLIVVKNARSKSVFPLVDINFPSDPKIIIYLFFSYLFILFILNNICL